MRWIKGLMGRWESLSRRRVLLFHFDRFHEASMVAGDAGLAEAVELLHDAWVEDDVEAAIAALTEARRRRREQAAQRRQRKGA